MHSYIDCFLSKNSNQEWSLAYVWYGPCPHFIASFLLEYWPIGGNCIYCSALSGMICSKKQELDPYQFYDIMIWYTGKKSGQKYWVNILVEISKIWALDLVSTNITLYYSIYYSPKYIGYMLKWRFQKCDPRRSFNEYYSSSWD